MLKIDNICEKFEKYWMIQLESPSDNDIPQDKTIYQLENKMKDFLIKHLVFVNATVSGLVDSYNKSENIASIEIDLFYRFILDLLGHNKDKIIFQTKVEIDSEDYNTVSLLLKVLSGFLILGLNVFFCTYAILKGYSKGLEWQSQYLSLCVFQLLTEVLVFSSVECILLHFTFPSLASVRLFAFSYLLYLLLLLIL